MMNSGRVLNIGSVKQCLVLCFLGILGILFFVGSCHFRPAAELVVYSARNEQLIKPLFDAFTQDTGITVSYHTDKAGSLLQRLKSEGAHSPADVLMTVDAGNLWQAKKMGLFRAVKTPIIQQNIPEYLRDPEFHWFGFSVRARTIVYHSGRVDLDDLSTYEDLADPKWGARLCLRTSKKVYNQSLVAMMLAERGNDYTQAVLSGWVANLATDVFLNDTKVMESILAGRGDVGIVNSYYFGRLLRDNPDIPLRLFWPNQRTSGVHVNVSGAGVLQYSKHPKAAIRLMEWLSEPKAQQLFSELNMEYPVNRDVGPTPFVKSWGRFKQNTSNLNLAGQFQSEAITLMDQVGYD